MVFHNGAEGQGTHKIEPFVVSNARNYAGDFQSFPVSTGLRYPHEYPQANGGSGVDRLTPLAARARVSPRPERARKA